MIVQCCRVVLLTVSSGLVPVTANIPGCRRAVPQDSPVETVPVVVATVDIPRYKIIDPSDVALVMWPRELAPTSSVSELEHVLCRVAKSPVARGAFVSGLELLDETVPLPAVRAYTFRARLVPSQTPTFLIPGQKVDVLLNLRESFYKPADGRRTIKLLEAVTVLDVKHPQPAPGEEDGAGKHATSLTIVVNPAQANMIDLGQQMGELMVPICRPVESEFAPAAVQSPGRQH